MTTTEPRCIRVTIRRADGSIFRRYYPAPKNIDQADAWSRAFNEASNRAHDEIRSDGGSPADRSFHPQVALSACLEDAERRMRVAILETTERAVQLQVFDPLPNVPEWIEFHRDGGNGQPFWTLPADHYFERSEGKLGFPGALADTLERFAASEVPKEEAEGMIAKTLIDWSHATNW